MPEGEGHTAWESAKQFLTRGSARWAALVGVGLLVGVVCVVSHPAAVSQLRQNLLLHNHGAAGAQQLALRRVRRALENSDAAPILHAGAWDDIHHVQASNVRPAQLAAVDVHKPVGEGILGGGIGDTGEDNFFPASAAHALARARSETVHAQGRSACASQCDANGYSAAEAGKAAASACIGVCLQEAGARSPSHTPPRTAQMEIGAAAASAGNGHLDSAQRLLAKVQAKVQAQATGQQPAGTTGQRFLPDNLAGIVSALGVSGSALPKAQQQQLHRAVALDGAMQSREEFDRSQLRQSWGAAVRRMQTLDAARFQNAKGLDAATERAVSENKATMALDASVLSAAAQFGQEAQEAGKLPVDAPKAQQQLDVARSAQKQVEQAAQYAGKILSDERMKWHNGEALVSRQLNSASFVDPGADVEGRDWAALLKSAAALPKADAAKVQLAAMSNGRLQAMSRKTWETQRQHMTEMAADIRKMQAARAANAQLVAQRMATTAAQKRADTQLLTAEAHYQSTVSRIGGKSDIAVSPTGLDKEMLRDAQEASALQRAAHAGNLMANRYRSVASSAAAPEAMAALKGGAGDDGAVSHVRGRARKAHAVHAMRQRRRATGAQAVRAASEGWFSI